jgi:hypothetical protein
MDPGRGATYRVQRVADGYIIHATGKNPTAGWKNLLAVSMLRIYPQQFEFRQRAPEGMVAQVITDYSTCLKWKTTERFDMLTIRDADGAHPVKVE